MIYNLTQETCTGTGNVLTLTGPSGGMIAFGATGNVPDGALVSSMVNDGNGVTRVAGSYTFDKTANTLTRQDTWNYNGIAVDNNPATNIALSGGTHTVRCVVVSRGLSIAPSQPAKWLMNANGVDTPDNWDGSTSTSNTPAANDCKYLGIRLYRARVMTNLVVNVKTADAGATVSKAGIYSVASDGKPGQLLGAVSIDVATSGVKSTALPAPILLSAGDYYTAFASNGAPTVMAATIGAFSATSYANTFNVPRNYHPKELLTSGWTDLPSAPNPTIFIENFPAIVGWT